jgi:outer membrane immunogenic protein
MKHLVLAGIALGLLAGPTMAADMAAKAPIMKAPPPIVYNWTGCYISGGVGYGMWNQDHSTTTAFTVGAAVVPNITTIETTGGGRGWLGRFGAGCDYQVSSNWVIGLFGDYDWMNLKGSVSSLTVNAFGNPLSADEKETAAWAAGARIGYLIAPSVLTYVDGGFTEARFGEIDLVSNLGVPNGRAFPAHTYQGWFVGSGFEYAFTWLPIQGLFVRSEYRYATYKKDDLTEFVLATGAPSGNTGLGNVLHSDKQVQTITTSLVWRFNWGGPVVARY